jgi:hypothetical protein
MPHAFKADPNHPAVAYLVRLHADLGGRILENRKEAKRLAESMKHVEAVIRLFDPAYDTRRIAVRRRYKSNPWFKRGTVLRHALDVLRTAEGPLTVREITDRMLKAKGVTNAKSEAVNDLCNGVRISLRKYEGKGVVAVGEGAPGRWELATR